MSLITEPCEKHELTNCAICTGVDRRHEESLRESELDPGSPPLIAGGPTIAARYAGNCAGCGRRYQAGDFIHYDKTDDTGWLAVGCCA